MSATRCYCGAPLRDGVCRHRCPPSASPKHLRAIDKARRTAEAKAKQQLGRGTLLNEQDMVKHREPQASVHDRRVANFKHRRIAKIRGSQCQGQK